ncbi:MAG: molecular chaperone GrpE [Cyclobacteriaceae bacterium]|jgi:molecular chaperone GrpE
MHKEKEEEIEKEEKNGQEVATATEESVENVEAEEVAEEPELSEVDQLKSDLAEAKDKYLRLYSEFENFRRRTSKEKLELIGSANKDLMADMIPVIDDFERAMKALDATSDADAAKEGMTLIFNKFQKTLEAKGLKKMEIKKGTEFNPDLHEAITQIPAEKKLVGKVVDVVEQGYFLNDKVVRFAKVVTGAKS